MYNICSVYECIQIFSVRLRFLYLYEDAQYILQNTNISTSMIDTDHVPTGKPVKTHGFPIAMLLYRAGIEDISKKIG